MSRQQEEPEGSVMPGPIAGSTDDRNSCKNHWERNECPRLALHQLTKHLTHSKKTQTVTRSRPLLRDGGEVALGTLVSQTQERDSEIKDTGWGLCCCEQGERRWRPWHPFTQQGCSLRGGLRCITLLAMIVLPLLHIEKPWENAANQHNHTSNSHAHTRPKRSITLLEDIQKQFEHYFKVWIFNECSHFLMANLNKNIMPCEHNMHKGGNVMLTFNLCLCYHFFFQGITALTVTFFQPYMHL